MADATKIEWTDATWNPITGCSVVSPGCTNCYAMKLAGTRLQHHPSRAGLTRETKAGPVWNGTVRFNEEWLTQPLAWKRPRMIFVCAHGDLFHEDVPDEWIDKVFAVMALAPQHTFQVLTKRAERMRAYMIEQWQGTPARTISLGRGETLHVPAGGPTGRRLKVEEACEPLLERFGLADTSKDHLWTGGGSCKAMQWQWPLPNVWLGVSAEDQKRADERVPELLSTPAAVRFVSAEPLLDMIDLHRLPYGDGEMNALKPAPWLEEIERWRGTSSDWEDDFLDWFDLHEMPTGGHMHPVLDWIIVGGENGPRPMQAEWAQSIRDQCAAAGTAFFFKQWGSHIPAGQTMANGKVWAPGCGTRLRATKGITGRLLDGVEHNAMPRAA